MGARHYNPGGFRIDGPDDYQDDVEEKLDAILKNPVGKVLLKFIDANPNYIWIVPYTGNEVCGDFTREDNYRDAAPPNVTLYKGNPYGATRDEKGNYVVTTPDDLADITGTGHGSDAHVHFSPGAYGGTGCGGGKYGSQPDEVLFHELVHGFRKMQGKSNAVPMVPKLVPYMNEEEWLAILIANIYIAAKNSHQNQLRENHQGHTELKSPLNSSAGFLKDQDHRKLVQKYLNEERDLFQALAEVWAPYNPIDEFVHNMTKYYQR